jgi:hypothetical protein
MKAKKQNNKIPVIMAEVSSLRDLVRLGSTFTPQLSYLYGMKAGKGNILFLKGEKNRRFDDGLFLHRRRNKAISSLRPAFCQQGGAPYG